MPPDNNVQREIELLEQRFAENSQGLVFAHLADAYRRAGEFGKAEGLILHGLKNHPNYTSAYNVLGRVYLDSERFEEAQQQFTKVLDLDPHNLAALRALADLAERDGRLGDARTWYERMLQVDPRSEEARAGLANLQAEVEVPPEMPAAQPAYGDVPEPPGSEPSADFGFEPESFPIEIEAEGDAGVEALQTEDAGGWPFEHELDAELDSAFAAATGGGAGEVEEEEIGPEPAAEPEGVGEPVSEAAGAESMEIDFGIMDDWTPALLDRDEGPAKSETEEASAVDFFEELEDSFTVDLGREEEEEEEEEEREGVEPAVHETPGEPVVTETMARLYADQGLYEDALRVYRQLAEARPDDEGVADRIRELEDQLAGRAPDRDEEVEELAELLELTEAGRTVGADADVPSAEPTDLQGGDGDGFRFEDEAPVAGLEHLDPFAASFDVFAMKEPPAAPAAVPAAEEREAEGFEPERFEAERFEAEGFEPEEFEVEEPATEEPIEEVIGAAGEEVTPEPVPARPEMEIVSEPPIVPADYEVPLADMEDVVQIPVEAEPFAEEALEEPEVEPAAPASQAEDMTIEEYLASLLEAEAREPEEEAPEAAPSEAAGGMEAAGSDDLEKFQEWLRSLKR